MKVMLAESMGMCFGVRDAIQMALSAPRGEDLTILGELVHNEEVLRRLRAAGIWSVPSVDAPVETSRVMITAHGASTVVMEQLRSRGLQIEDATCPLVAHAHRSLRRLVSQGYFPVVIGNRHHVEVRGLVEELEAYEVISSAAELPRLAGKPRLGVVSQTTQPPDLVRELVDQIRLAFPEAEVRFIDTVCQPTKERQAAARRLAACCPVIVVIGGRNSNNTRQLVRACEAEGARAYQVESAAELRPEWFAGVEAVGVTAGTSTPDELIEEVQRALLQLSPRTHESSRQAA